MSKAAASCKHTVRLMEVCGTHTNAIARNNLRMLLPDNVKLISGPGCPVCVSGVLFIEKIRTLLRSGVTVTTFGDLLRIPGAQGTLQGEKNLKIVYSPADALEMALKTPQQKVVFAAVGFAPTLSAAVALMSAVSASKAENFSILSDFKDLTVVLDKLCSSRQLDGLLLPGHVASVVGVDYFKNITVPGVVAGFEPENILYSLKMLLDAIGEKRSAFTVNNYPEAVQQSGNKTARQLIGKYFELTASIWRGLGCVEKSGWKLKEEFARFDAEKIYDLSGVSAEENPACRCGEVLTGLIEPTECPLFGKVCTPDAPCGACMSSQEGACAAYFNYPEGRA